MARGSGNLVSRNISKVNIAVPACNPQIKALITLLTKSHDPLSSQEEIGNVSSQRASGYRPDR